MATIWQLKSQRPPYQTDWGLDELEVNAIASGYILQSYALVWFFETKRDAILAREALRSRPCNQGMKLNLKEIEIDKIPRNSSALSY